MSHTFPELPYAYDALEPYIDAKTMEVHYSKHHRTYFDKFTAAIKGSDLENQSLETIFDSISSQAPAVRNNGGGYYNHVVYWNCMAPNAGGEPQGDLGAAITETFGSFEAFKEAFAQAAINTFGSGFAWLIVKDGKLVITSTSNQDNPLMDVAADRGEPVLALDVWEHAYYISYQNRRPEYIDAWWNVVNWDAVAQNYAAALAK
ncbi:Superoxide dismutase (Mn) [Vibrio nigripulchritudo MADA3029]|uniref:Superoxide dismutase n=1 Tax=Vibrio nigripulchritudo TaxID=28173 RepID=U4K9F5_9VIBR|nr:superoxide dismutase [Vibrio nigripulchritudo]CCN37515.1 Superoxide dismutase (Mn) [Vibrio nigripulchritudo AM115]CCN41668.1 Superoxide dismutase (Mn) [Vibrio nigripulchritudo FTn2]CCN47368.1 Superoxide dismutase (Mn) [Vibrio nigripulchritudo MADA3020]CCN53625.1 Superoxide dismutase (Mn) [Vibrio nigripulchritudo MADA3021]CCN58685.1 Superoxide dismutase (Mn) [Vibrio nigripulchritudo MADA3029]